MTDLGIFGRVPGQRVNVPGQDVTGTEQGGFKIPGQAVSTGNPAPLGPLVGSTLVGGPLTGKTDAPSKLSPGKASASLQLGYQDAAAFKKDGWDRQIDGMFS